MENSQKKEEGGLEFNIIEGIFIEFNKNLIDEHSNKKNVLQDYLLEDLDEDSPFQIMSQT